MAIFKCKMCGGDLNITEGTTVAECEYCGSTQTVPAADNEKKLTLFARANRLRLGNEFDKAAGVYESIVADFPEEAEAYWGLVLCKYGIEYVDDPATGKKIPTCHRSSFDSVLEDSDFEQACENADTYARRIYRDEAKQIEDLRRGIVAVSANEQPYDIFICYKETDENGQRTLDSVLAQDIYDALTGKDYRVFFSRVTLEDKLGVEYEPYIFAALNSAKVMLAVGTDYEYYNAVWVKNEWSRYLKLMTQDKDKHLIPCFKGIDAYDMPKEFARLQAQDMGKVGAMQDLLRGVEKLLGNAGTDAAAAAAAAPAANSTVDPLLKRVFMYLEDGEWKSADEYCEKVLDIDPENTQAYLGKLMAELRVRTQESLKDEEDPFDDNKNYQKIMRFADDILKAKLANCMKCINYSRAKRTMAAAKTAVEYWKTAELFGSIRDYQDSADCEKSCREVAEAKRNEHKALIRKRAQEENFPRTICSDYFTIGLRSDGTVVATGDNRYGQCNVSDWTNIVDIKTADGCIAYGLKSDGTVVVAGDTEDLSDWTDIESIYPCSGCIIGLRSDGTVVAAGRNEYGQCNVSGWTDIVSICADGWNTIGLKSDGTLVATGKNEYGKLNVSDWTDIVSIKIQFYSTIGLKADGTVVATGKNQYGELDVSDWTDIVSIFACHWVTFGLKSDGTVVATGNNKYGQCNVADWRDIVEIFANVTYTIGLRSDGTVVATGENKYGELNVSDWADIVSIKLGCNSTIGLKADGTVVVTGENEDGELNVSDWSDIVSIDPAIIGLRSDGTVVAAGKNEYGELNVSDWTGIAIPEAAIAARNAKTEQGRKEKARREQEEAENREIQRKDKVYDTYKRIFAGEVPRTEENWYAAKKGFEAIAGWRDADSLAQQCAAEALVCAEEKRLAAEKLVAVQVERARREAEERARREQEEAEQKRKEEARLAEEKRREEERLAAERAALVAKLQQEQTALEAELAGLKGLFTGKRRREIEARLEEIRKGIAQNVS